MDNLVGCICSNAAEFFAASLVGAELLPTEVLANAQLVSSKLADMYLCSDGLPIEKSSLFKGYQTIKSEWQNRDNRMRYTLMRPGDSFWD